MRLLDANNEVIVAMSEDEFLLLANSVGEALEAIEDWEFSTRVGVSPDAARTLQGEMSEMLLQIAKPE